MMCKGGTQVKRKTAKELLAESFRELARDRDIDRITVQDIAKNCGYSIATFYRQFRDKYDLIAWDYARDVQKLLDQEDGTPKEWRQSLSDAAVYYDEQREYLANLLTNTSGYDSFIQYMTEIHFSALMSRIRAASGQSGPDQRTQMLVRLYVFGTVMLTCEWIMGKYPVSRKVLTEVYVASLPEPLYDIFNKK